MTMAAVVPTSVGYVHGKPVMMRAGEPVLFTGIQYWGLDTWNLDSWDTDLHCMGTELKLNGIRLNIAWDHIELADNVFDFTNWMPYWIR